MNPNSYASNIKDSVELKTMEKVTIGTLHPPYSPKVGYRLLFAEAIPNTLIKGPPLLPQEKEKAKEKPYWHEAA